MPNSTIVHHWTFNVGFSTEGQPTISLSTNQHWLVLLGKYSPETRVMFPINVGLKPVNFPLNQSIEPIESIPMTDPWCWNIYQHLPHKWPSFVGKYSSTMDPSWELNIWCYSTIEAPMSIPRTSPLPATGTKHGRHGLSPSKMARWNTRNGGWTMV